MVEKLFGEEGIEDTSKQTRGKGRQDGLQSEGARELVDMLAREGNNKEKLDAIADKISNQQKSSGDISITQPIEAPGPGQYRQPTRSEQQAPTLEGFAGGIFGQQTEQPQQENARDQDLPEQEQTQDQDLRGREQEEPSEPEQQVDTDKMMADFRQELIAKYNLPPAEADKLVSIYTQELGPEIEGFNDLQEQLQEKLQMEMPKDPKVLRAVLIQSIITTAISGGIAAATGSYMFLLPGLLIQGFSAYSRLNSDEQTKFIRAIKGQKKILENLSTMSKDEINATLAQVEEAIKKKQVDPEFFQQNIEIIREHNQQLADEMGKLIEYKTRSDDSERARRELAINSIRPDELRVLGQQRQKAA